MTEDITGFKKPEYEVRAEAFKEGVNQLINESEDHGGYFGADVEDALETWISGFDKLQAILSEDTKEGLAESQMPNPGDLANNLDIRSASEALIQVYATCDSYSHLVKFVEKVTGLATNHKAEINNDFLGLLGTGEEDDLISSLDYTDEGIGWMYVTHLNFSFSDDQGQEFTQND